MKLPETKPMNQYLRLLAASLDRHREFASECFPKRLGLNETLRAALEYFIAANQQTGHGKDGQVTPQRSPISTAYKSYHANEI